MKIHLELSREIWPQIKSLWAKQCSDREEGSTSCRTLLMHRIEEIAGCLSSDQKSAHAILDGIDNYDAVFVRMLINTHDKDACYTSINNIVLSPRLLNGETPEQDLVEVVQSVITTGVFLALNEKTCRIVRISINNVDLLVVFEKIVRTLRQSQAYRHVEFDRSCVTIVL